MYIRRAVEQDFPEVLKVQAEAFGEYEGTYEVSGWTKETLENVAFNALDKVILVAEWEQAIVGSVRFWVAAHAGDRATGDGGSQTVRLYDAQNIPQCDLLSRPRLSPGGDAP